MYQVEKIKDHIYHISDNIDNPSSMYCIIGSEKVLWVDASNSHPEHEQELVKIKNMLAQDKEVICLITHTHFDHVGSINVFSKKVYIPIHDDKLDKEYDTYQDGDVFDLGDMQFKAIEVPGHTSGSMVIVDEKNEVILTGDAIGSSFVWLFFMDNVLEHYKKGIHHLYHSIKDYKEPLFLCGHRYQQASHPGRDPLSPINSPMTMQYVIDMIELVNRIENKTALMRDYAGNNNPEEHCVYSFEGSFAEIDSFKSLIR